VKTPALLLVSLVLLPALVPAATRKPTKPLSDAASMQQKLRHLDANAHAPHPDQTPTTLTEPEANAYFASGNVKLPAGVQSLRLAAEPEVITGDAQIDFDRVREGTHSSNPLLSMFSGVHEVVVVAHAHGGGGQGFVHVDSVALDGVEIPHFVLELFVEKFLTPKNPQIGMDSQFTLPDRIDTATVGLHKLTVTQR
jgi:hypothetical protein